LIIKMIEKEKTLIMFCYNYKNELLLLRGLKPSSYDHLGLFLGCCLVWRVKHQRHYSVRACLKNLYRMLDLNRHPLLHTTSRKAAPLGDPRGIPKLSRKFSLRKCYLRIRERAYTSVHHFKFEGSINIFTASTSARRKFFQVNIDLAKMSDFEEMGFYSFFDGLLEELSDTVEFVSDDSHLPILSDEELDFTSDFNIDMLNMATEVTNPPSNYDEAAHQPPTQEGEEATVVINIQNETDVIWNPAEIRQQPAEIILNQPVEIRPAPPVVTNEQTEREKNNKASRAYRKRRKDKLAAEEKELEVLEKKNRELSVKASAMEDIVTELKSKVVSLIENAGVRGGKRNHEDDRIVRKRIKM